MLLTCKVTRESPVIEEPVRVTLLTPARPALSGPPAERAETRTPPKEVKPAPVTPPKQTFKPVFFTRTSRKSEPVRKAEWSKAPTPLERLEKEATPSPATTVRELQSEAGVSVLAGSSWSYDALVAGYIKSNWIRPSRAVVGDNPSAVKVAVRIAMNGRITESRVTKTSGVSALDASAFDAIKKSNPLPMGLPSYMARRSYDVTIVFCITDEV
jgi:TonB family protein